MTVHLLEGRHRPERVAALLAALTTRYAEILDSPVERVRACVRTYPPEHWATGGEPGREAPYVEALVLAGRPVEQRHRLLAGFTDLVVEILGADRALVRARTVPVDPDDWGIAGRPASAARRAEIDARAAGG